MKESLRVSIKIYLRSIRFIVSFLAVLTASGAFLCSLNKSANDLEFLKDSLQLGLLGILFFSVSTYELMSLSFRTNCDEVISCQFRAREKLYLSHASVQIAALVIWNLFVLLWHFVRYSLNADVYAPYYLHIFQSMLLYCFLPGVVAILLGCAICKMNRSLAYTTVILFVLLSSSIPSKLFSWYQAGEFSFAKLHDWFQLAVPNSNWVSDSVYGIGLEGSRWVIVGFWIFSLLAATLLVLGRKSTIGHKSVIAVFGLLAVIFAVCFTHRHDTYVMYKDDRPDGIIYSEYNYRLENPDTVSPKEANFSIDSYILDIVIDSTLACDATLRFEENSLGEYAFTLYHGYEIVDICGLDGEALRYDRCSDYITVYSSDPLDGIRICYTGNADKYYANRQGIALPGYFAFYPMAGHLQQWDDISVSYRPIVSRSESYFDVTVSSNLTVYSNLEAVGYNHFLGSSSALTLYAGILEESVNGNITYCYSPVSSQSIGLSAEEIEKEWSRIKQMLDLDYDLTIAGKTVFYQPFTMRSAVGNNESIVVLEDHILLCDLSYSPETICAKYLMNSVPIKGESELLWNMFYEYIYSKPELTVTEKPAYSDIEMLVSVGSITELTDEGEIALYLLAEDSFANLMLYQIQTLGEEYTLQKVYEYLSSDAVEVNQADFLYNLGGD